jgi:hypothetical protein
MYTGPAIENFVVKQHVASGVIAAICLYTRESPALQQSRANLASGRIVELFEQAGFLRFTLQLPEPQPQENEGKQCKSQTQLD